MAADTIQKIINIQFNYGELVEGWKKTQQAIQDNKRTLDEVRAEYKRGELSTKEYRQAQLELKNTDKALRSELNQYTKEIQNNIRIEKEEQGSINQLRANVANLTAQYNKMSAARRESSEGKLLAQNIKSEQEAINEAEMALGNYRSQVGNYENAIRNALGMNDQWINSLMDIEGTAKSFGSALKSTLLTPIGAIIGAGTAVVGVFKLWKSSIHETQATGDAYDNAMAGWRATWDLFKKSVSAVDFSLFIRNAAEAAAAGRDLQLVLDELFERNNSIRLQRAFQTKENAELEETLRNTGLSYQKRLAAGEKYIENIRGIYEQEAEVARDARDSQLHNLFTLIKTRKYASKEEQKAAEEEFAANIKNYNLNRQKILAADELISAEENLARIRLRRVTSGWNAAAASATLYDEAEANERLDVAQKKFKQVAKENAEGIYEFQKMYRLTADEQVNAYIEAEEKLQQMDSALFNENKRIVNSINSVRAQATNEYVQNKKKEVDAEFEASRNIIEIENKLAQERENMRNKFRANTEDFTEGMDKEWLSDVEGMMKQKTAEYQNRLLRAQTQGGDASKEQEMIRIAREQVAILEEQLQDVDAFSLAYSEMGLSAVEIDNKRLQALQALQNAQKSLNDAEKKEADDKIKQQNKQTQMSLRGAQQLAGALGDLAQEAGASSGVVAMLSIAESAAAMGSALHKAFASSWNVWEGIAAAVAAITTITTIIAQIKSLNSSAADEKTKYRYAEGGLVTGPGTGTSDSITAKLSNGEAVMTARAVANWGDVLSAINVSSGGNAIPTNNLPQKGDGWSGMERAFEKAIMKMPVPVVSVKDINAGQRRVKVSENLGKLGKKSW